MTTDAIVLITRMISLGGLVFVSTLYLAGYPVRGRDKLFLGLGMLGWAIVIDLVCRWVFPFIFPSSLRGFSIYLSITAAGVLSYNFIRGYFSLLEIPFKKGIHKAVCLLFTLWGFLCLIELSLSQKGALLFRFIFYASLGVLHIISFVWFIWKAYKKGIGLKRYILHVFLLSGLGIMRIFQLTYQARAVEPPVFLSTLGIFGVIVVYFIFFCYALAVDNRNARQYQEELEKRIDEKSSELERSMEQKERFFIQFAHETKTPLMLISSYLERYAKAVPPHEDLDIVKRYVFRLQTDVVNYLDYEKFSKERLSFNHNQKINISELVAEHIKGFQLIATGRQIVLRAKIQDRVWMTVDPAALYRIMNNLLENALKYSNPGSVIESELSSNSAHVIFAVRDTGLGIPQNKLLDVFRPFYQIDARGSPIGGLGMGLNIVARIVEELGGTIEAKSRTVEAALDGGWTTVIEVNFPSTSKRNSVAQPTIPQPVVLQPPFLMPIVETAVSTEPEEQSKDEAPLLLIVEDNEDLRKILSTSLSARYRTMSTEDGLKALQWLDSGNKPDIIISDIMMAGMDGYSLFRELKRNPGYRDIPFIFLTAISSPLERVKSFSEGAIDFITKPLFSMSELEFKISSLLKLIRNKENEVRRDIMDKLANVVSGEAGHNTDKQSKTDNIFRSLGLTEREHMVIEYMKKGLQNKEIGAKMGISPRTIDNHVYKIYRKTGCQNRTELLNKIYS